MEKKIDELEGKLESTVTKMNKKVDESNQELIKLVSTIINMNLEDKLKELKTEFSTKVEVGQSHQALAQMVKTSLDEKMDTILATLQEATTTHL